MLGVCGIRIAWIEFVFPQSRTFRTIMTVYPVSLSSTMLLILAALICFRPSGRFAPPAVITYSSVSANLLSGARLFFTLTDYLYSKLFNLSPVCSNKTTHRILL